MLKTIRKNLEKKNSDNLKKILFAGILGGGLILQNSVAFAGDADENYSEEENYTEEESSTDENISNPYAYNTIETDDTQVNFNGASSEYDGNYSVEITNKEGAGDVYSNKLTINGGTFKFIVDGGNYSGNFLNNEVYLNGGYFYFGISDAEKYGVKISDNLFSINGGTFANEYIELSNSAATNNTVTISGAPDISNAYIYGGLIGDVGESSGNVLNFYSSGLKARNIYDFDTINFYVPENVQSGETLLTLTEGKTDLAETKVNAYIDGNTSLNPGDTINLLTNENGLNYSDTGNFEVFEGATLNYEGSKITGDENNLVLTLGTPRVNEETRLFAQGVLNTGVTLSRGTDRIIDWLPPEELDEAVADGENIVDVVSNNWGIFLNLEAAKLKTKTGSGSYVDSKGGGIDLGFARALTDSRGGSFIFAPIFDYGKTRFDGYLADGTHGSGHSRYFAGGVIGRKTWRNGVYLEGSFRGGSSKTDFASDYLAASYSKSTPVFAGHIRAGRLLRINKNNLLHYYGLYSHNHVNSFGATLSTGEHYDFDSVDSGKFKIGYRLTTRVSNLSKLYTGLAYQYEFNGSASANYKGYKTVEAEVKGSSGMLELGWQLHANKESAWLVDFNVTGWIGVQKGVTASAQVKKSF